MVADSHSYSGVMLMSHSESEQAPPLPKQRLLALRQRMSSAYKPTGSRCKLSGGVLLVVVVVAVVLQWLSCLVKGMSLMTTTVKVRNNCGEIKRI